MRKQRGEADGFLLVMVALFFCLLGGFFLMIYSSNEQAIECMKVNTTRTAVEVKILCR